MNESYDTKQTEMLSAQYEDYPILCFGHYWEDANKEKRMPVSWHIIARESEKILILSEKVLDAGTPLEYSFITKPWAESGLRNWLNNSFLNDLCSDAGKELIVPVAHEGIEDSVFILSGDEAERYLTDRKEIRACATEYAMKQLEYSNSFMTYPNLIFSPDGYSDWLLRRTSSDSQHSDSSCSGVSYKGNITFFSLYVEQFGMGSETHIMHGIRPAMWIDQSMLAEREKKFLLDTNMALDQVERELNDWKETLESLPPRKRER